MRKHAESLVKYRQPYAQSPTSTNCLPAAAEVLNLTELLPLQRCSPKTSAMDGQIWTLHSAAEHAG